MFIEEAFRTTKQMSNFNHLNAVLNAAFKLMFMFQQQKSSSPGPKLCGELDTS
jgi:hypothetical protein